MQKPDIEFDDNNDGTIDRIKSYNPDDNGYVISTLNVKGITTRLENYDGDGRITLLYEDSEGDRRVNQLTTYGYNDAGILTFKASAFDYDSDGWSDRKETYFYDDQGHLVRRKIDIRSKDGSDINEYYTLDDEGQPIGISLDFLTNGELSRVVYDKDADGTAEKVIEYTYNDSGMQTTEKISIDENDDGKLDRIETHRLNGGRHRIRSEIDSDADGTMDSVETYILEPQRSHIRTYIETDTNADGKVDRKAYDKDEDGKLEEIHHYTYNAEGVLASKRLEYYGHTHLTIPRRIRVETITVNEQGLYIRTEVDEGDNGRIDQISINADGDSNAERIEDYTYNADGVKTTERIRIDENDDGTADQIELHTLNAEGQRIQSKIDYDADGTFDTTQTHTPDAPVQPDPVTPVRNSNGQLLRIGYDEDGDGTPDRIHKHTYDADGVKETETISYDDDDDGTVDRIELRTLNAKGHHIRSDIDSNADKTTDRIEIYTVDRRGHRTSAKIDETADGSIDRVETYLKLNAQGQPNRTRIDSNNDSFVDREERDKDRDGTPDRITEYTYGEGGVLTTSRVQHDGDDDGEINSIETTTWNEQGQKTRVERDDGADGSANKINTYTFTDGRLSMEVQEADRNDDGEIDRIRTLTFSTRGRITRMEEDRGADGKVDYIWVDEDGDGNKNLHKNYHYNDEGVRTTEILRIDDNDNGFPERLETHTLNAQGQRIRSEIDENINGKPDLIETYSYTQDQLTRREIDSNADGNVDSVENYTLNDQGHRIRTDIYNNNNGSLDRVEHDKDADGTLEEIHDYEYNDQGDRSKETIRFFNNDDGSVNRIEKHTLNAAGQRTRSEMDENADGIVDSVGIYSFDDAGRRIRVDTDANNDGRMDRIEHDRNADGTLEEVHDYEYNDEGVRTKETIRFRNDADGSVNRVEFHTLNAAGQRILSEIDEDGDGTVDSTDTHSPDEPENRPLVVEEEDDNGRLIRVSYDANRDGTPEKIHEYSYNAVGERTTEKISFDSTEDGTPDRVELHTLNVRGQRIRSEIDNNADGSMDLIESYTLNSQGGRTRIEVDSNVDDRWDMVSYDSDADGTPEKIHHYTYNSVGVLITEKISYFGSEDGSLDRTELHALNAQGRRRRSDIDSDADGTVDSIETFFLNGRGQPTRTEIDSDADNRVDRIKYDSDGDGNPHKIIDYTYNAEDATVTERIQLDHDDDGETDRIETYTLNDQKLVTRTAIDRNGDGTVDFVDEFTYNAEGLRTQEVHKSYRRSDGKLFYISTTTLNDRGDRILIETDITANGTIDRITKNPDDRSTFESRWPLYNVKGMLIKETVLLGLDENGIIKRIETHFFDAQGFLTRNEVSYDGDLTADLVETYHEFNDQGKPTRTETDNNNDGKVDKIEHDSDGDGSPEKVHDFGYSDEGVPKAERVSYYDTQEGSLVKTEHHSLNTYGNRVRSEIDEGADNRIDQIIVDKDGARPANRIHDFTYNSDGVKETETIKFDNDDDGQWDRIELHTFNDQGQRIRTDIDSDGDGTVDNVETFLSNNEDESNPVVPTNPVVPVNPVTPSQGVRKHKFYHDEDGDGTPDLIVFAGFDAQGQLHTEVSRFISPQNGRLAKTELGTLDDNLQVVRIDQDRDADGLVDLVETYVLTYGGPTAEATLSFVNGRLSRVDHDLEDDGFEDRVHEYTYNEDGVITSERIEFYSHSGGRLVPLGYNRTSTSRIERHIFNDQGERIRTEIDSNGDHHFERTNSNIADGPHRTTQIVRNASGRIDRIAYDRDRDGTPEEIHDYTYNDQSVRTTEKIQYDFEDDGTVDRIDTLTLNDSGKVTRRDIDNDADGLLNRTNTYLYTGDVLSEEIWKFDGNEDGTTFDTYKVTLNDQGQRVRIETDYNADGKVEHIATDADGDGTSNRVENITYNSEGVKTTEQVLIDNNDDGSADRIELHTLNAQGQPTRIEIDDDADGTVDIVDTFTLNDQGRPTRIETDHDVDNLIDVIAYDEDSNGIMERIRDFTYNDQGLRATERIRFFEPDNGSLIRIELHTLNDQRQRVRSELDDDADGTNDLVETYIFDDSAQPVRIETDNGADGSLDKVQYDRDGDGTAHKVETYTYNDDGVRTTRKVELDYDDDGTADRIETSTLNDRNLVTRIDIDSDADGTIDRTNSYTYNGDIRLTEQWEFDDNDDGEIDRVFKFKLNSQGQRISGEVDEGNDGKMDQTGEDEDGDGNSNIVREYTYSRTGTLTTEKISTDTNDDGSYDRIELLRFDFRGRQTRGEIDRDGDGTVDRIDVFNTRSGDLEAMLSSTYNDGKFDLIQLEADLSYKLSSTYKKAGKLFSISGTYLENIQLNDGESSELILTASNIRDMADGNTDLKVMIQGGSDDTVDLRDKVRRNGNVVGKFEIRDENEDGNADTTELDGITYKIYDAMWKGDEVGSVLIHQDVIVNLPD